MNDLEFKITREKGTDIFSGSFDGKPNVLVEGLLVMMEESSVLESCILSAVELHKKAKKKEN